MKSSVRPRLGLGVYWGLRNPTRLRRHLRALAQSGFTLIEVVGVLGIIAILAAVVTENVLKRIKLAHQNTEVASMTAVGGTLQTSIKRTKSIPAATNLASAVATYLSQSVTKVKTTVSGNTRLFLVDPNFRVGTNSALTPPYTQSSDGSVQPISPRVLVLSSLGPALPAIEQDAGAFANIWNTAPNGVPAGWPAAWAGRGQDLQILRLDMGSSFHRVILENLDLYHVAPYSIETTNTLTSVPVGSRKEMWFIDSTVINFHYNDSSLQAREYIVEDVSYVYENGGWRRYLWYGPSISSGWFGQMVDAFLAAQSPPGTTRRYSNQQWVIDAMYTFLYDFGQWSQEPSADGHGFSGGPPWPHIPGYEQASAGASGLTSYSGDLINYYY